jgi:hypothetical protein
MSNDKRLQLRLTIAVLTCAICACLYSWSGVECKWFRRFAMPAVYFAVAFGLTRNWKVLLGAPLSVLGLCLGYGADALWLKVIKRAYCGVLIGAGLSQSLVFAFVAMTASVILGVFNPFPARVEEMLLGAIYSSAIFLYVKER